MNKFIYFDVGANWGEKSLGPTRSNPNWHTFAFEPTPQLVQHLRQASRDISDRYTIEPVALSNFTGTAQFNIQNHPGQGCNSLNDFNDGLDKIFPHFCNEQRNDLIAVEQISVNVVRLDDWFKQNSYQIDRIDYFKCDTQGSDLRVLEGMGDYIHLIRSGEVECSRSAKTKLYKQNHTVEEMLEFLKDRGFRVPKILSNDHLDNEYNVFFEKD